MRCVLVSLLLISVLIGCADPNLERPVIEDLGMVSVMGFDYVDQEKIKVTVTMPQPSQAAEEPVQQFSSTVESPHQAIMDISTLTEKTLTPAQLRVLLFSEEYARKEGLMTVLDNLYRDPQVGANIFIAVVKGKVEDMLSGSYKDKPEINIYITELLTPRPMTAFSPFTTLHSFINRKTDEVSDPSTPYLEVVNGDSIKLTKIALFSDDKMVNSIEPEEAKLVEAMKGKKKLPDIMIEVPSPDGKEEEILVMKFVSSKMDVKVNGNLQNPEIFIYLYIRGSIIDYYGTREIDSHDTRENIEVLAGEHFEENVIKAISHFQEVGVDPVGIGDYFRIQNARNWSKEKWIDAFKQAKVTTHVETRIVSTGTIK